MMVMEQCLRHVAPLSFGYEVAVWQWQLRGIVAARDPSQSLGSSRMVTCHLAIGGSRLSQLMISCAYEIQFRRISLIGFPAQTVRSSNAIALDSLYLLVLIIGTSQSRQHVDTSLIHIESCKPPIAELFDVDYGRISIVTMNTKEYHSDVLASITRIMRKTLDKSL
ncbi:hypothetical protein Tco_0167905 [Tanacetum coccineum]